MKKLYILRHAKAGKNHKKILDDHERPLTGSGIKSCELLADYLKENAEKPQLVLSSTAKRTRETFENIFADYLPKLKAEFDQRLYLANSSDIFSLVNETPGSVSSLMIIAHNPGLHEFCLQLTGEAEKPLLKLLKDGFPPASLAIFALSEKNWSSVKRKSGRLTQFVIPRNLTD